jgi:apolipoprotein N-acyltransferase
MATAHLTQRDSSTGISAAIARVPPFAWLVLGVAINLMTSKRWGVDAFAWIAPIPYLIYLRTTTGMLSRVWLVVAILIGTTLGVVKIATGFIGLEFIVRMGTISAIPISILYLLWDQLNRRGGDVVGLYSFPALWVALEWILSNWESTGSWAGMANMQADNLVLLQIGSIFGITAVTFLISWVAALGALLLTTGAYARWSRHTIGLILVMAAVHIYGTLRLYGVQSGQRVRVAAVVAPLEGYPGVPRSPTSRYLTTADLDYHLAKTAEAAERGAQLVGWSEASVGLNLNEEADAMRRISALARERNIHIAAGIGVDRDRPDGLYDNKFVLFRPDGTVAIDYLKHEPVPGEQSVRGTAPITAASTPLGMVSGAICYDMDFPWISLALARAGTGLAVAPSSDWVGIDPLHTKMSRFRAIENGFSLLRPVNMAASAAFDGYGRVQGWMPFFEQNDRILMATLPSGRIDTIYSRIGDAFSYACFLGLAFAAFLALRRRRPREDAVPDVVAHPA